MKSSVLATLLRDNPLVVTGLGCYSAAGDSVDALWGSALAGRGLAAWREFPIAGHSQRFAVCSAPPLDGFVPELRSVRKADRCAQMAMHAAIQAWNAARVYEEAIAIIGKQIDGN